MRTKPMEYSLVIAAVSDAYNRIGQKDKGYNYLVKSIEPIDQRFNAFAKDLQAMGKEKAFNALVGQVMKASKGKANPGQVNKLLKKKLA